MVPFSTNQIGVDDGKLEAYAIFEFRRARGEVLAWDIVPPDGHVLARCNAGVASQLKVASWGTYSQAVVLGLAVAELAKFRSIQWPACPLPHSKFPSFQSSMWPRVFIFL
jgi:hypothetical protein